MLLTEAKYGLKLKKYKYFSIKAGNLFNYKAEIIKVKYKSNADNKNFFNCNVGYKEVL